jgi:hypothetical protein
MRMVPFEQRRETRKKILLDVWALHPTQQGQGGLWRAWMHKQCFYRRCGRQGRGLAMKYQMQQGCPWPGCAAALEMRERRTRHEAEPSDQAGSSFAHTRRHVCSHISEATLAGS